MPCVSSHDCTFLYIEQEGEGAALMLIYLNYYHDKWQHLPVYDIIVFDESRLCETAVRNYRLRDYLISKLLCLCNFFNLNLILC